MKILRFTLFLYLSFFANSVIYADNNTLIANYPAPSGSYNKVVLQNLQDSPATICSKTNSNGMLFMYIDPSTNAQSLEICANGTGTAVPYPETCFNRFCYQTCPNPASSTLCSSPNNPCYPLCPGGGGTPVNCNFNGCPAGYSWGTIPETTFKTYTDTSGNSYWTSSAVCCTTNSTVQS